MYRIKVIRGIIEKEYTCKESPTINGDYLWFRIGNGSNSIKHIISISGADIEIKDVSMIEMREMLGGNK